MKKPGEIAFTLTPRGAHSAAKRPGQRKYAVLAHGIERAELEAAMGGKRGDVDDAAGSRAPACAVRPPVQAKKTLVRLIADDPLIVGAGELLSGLENSHSLRIDEDVDPAVPGDRFVTTSVNAAGLRHVGAMAMCCRAVRGESSLDLARPLASVLPTGTTIAPASCKPSAICASDAARTAENQRDLVRPVKTFGILHTAFLRCQPQSQATL